MCPVRQFLSATPDPLFPTQVPLRGKAAGVMPHRHAEPRGARRDPLSADPRRRRLRRQQPLQDPVSPRRQRRPVYPMVERDDYRSGRKHGDEIMMPALFANGNPNGLSPSGAASRGDWNEAGEERVREIERECVRDHKDHKTGKSHPRPPSFLCPSQESSRPSLWAINTFATNRESSHGADAP